MKKYNCRICGAGVYTADTTVESVLCAECERDEQINKMRSPEEIKAETIAQRVAMVAEDDAEYHLGWVEALEWVLGAYDHKSRDLVEVVRCKDCAYFFMDEVNSWCKQFGEIYATPNDYCAWGERRAK